MYFRWMGGEQLVHESQNRMTNEEKSECERERETERERGNERRGGKRE